MLRSRQFTGFWFKVENNDSSIGAFSRKAKAPLELLRGRGEILAWGLIKL